MALRDDARSCPARRRPSFAEEEPAKKGYEGITISACMLLTALVLIAIAKLLF
jgi:hypothetical protein